MRVHSSLRVTPTMEVGISQTIWSRADILKDEANYDTTRGDMDCYIVPIYRREEHDHRVVAGLVETVGLEKRERFSGPEELWKILCPKESGRRKRAAGRKEKGSK